ncbi:hypothetical protein DFH07DRAFT_962303 [Mycena maculata]|uniref:Bacteriophage T5 Orf172 DNA-binding domain-containing protein n=1 Tax=Mycena maculata TaxID=230809 RepID=A0AAD7IRR2_9AGAR|nr:hypothetical protein DFH07DRAFT_962303 [Mycena maculata]
MFARRGATLNSDGSQVVPLVTFPRGPMRPDPAIRGNLSTPTTATRPPSPQTSPPRREARRTMSAATPAHPDILAAFNGCRVAASAPGALYVFDLPLAQGPPLRAHAIAALPHAPPPPPSAEVKIGYATKPHSRRVAWRSQCRGETHDWWRYWNVPNARAFEKLIHAHFTAHGAWNGRCQCRYCLVRHQEKFDLATCGGRAGVVAVVRDYHGLLGWIVDEHDM